MLYAFAWHKFYWNITIGIYFSKFFLYEEYQKRIRSANMTKQKNIIKSRVNCVEMQNVASTEKSQ